MHAINFYSIEFHVLKNRGNRCGDLPATAALFSLHEIVEFNLMREPKKSIRACIPYYPQI